jgi:putative membrane protein
MDTVVYNKPLFFDLSEVEGLIEEEAKVTLHYTPPLILPEEVELELPLTTMPKPTPSATVYALPIPKFPSLFTTALPWLWLLAAIGGLIFLMLAVETVQYIYQQFTHNILLGTIFLSLTVFIAGMILVLSWRAYQNVQHLRNVSALQRQGQQIIDRNGYGNAIAYLNHIAPFYANRPNMKIRLERFYLTINDRHHDREICALFSEQVMKELDQQAYRIVAQRAQETALMVMISRLALLDALLTLWRNVQMVQDLATLYGGRPGFAGSLRLMVTVAYNLIYAEISEVVADSVAEILGNSMVSILSAQVAQGLGSGFLTARMGLQTIRACRPLPFLEGEQPRLQDIRREVIKSLRNVFEAREKSGEEARGLKS